VEQEKQTEIKYLNIIGQIEGHMLLPPQNKTTKYEHVLPLLAAAEENPDIHGLFIPWGKKMMMADHVFGRHSDPSIHFLLAHYSKRFMRAQLFFRLFFPVFLPLET